MTAPNTNKEFALARVGILAMIVLFTGAWAVYGHGSESSDHTAAWWSRWSWETLPLINLLLASAIYTRGLSKLWRHSGVGRGVTRGQAAAFAIGIVALVIALLSPVDTLSDELFWVHMIQHMTIMMIAAPLLIMGSPGFVALWNLPAAARKSLAHWRFRLGAWNPAWYLLWQPILLWLFFGFALWVWHLPSLYQAALRNQLVHDFQHFGFLLASCLFWRVLLDPLSRLRLSRGVGVLYLFTTSLHATVLGVFLALSPRVWYPYYAATTPTWNLTALEDQQLAGLIMWMPACMIFSVAAAVIFALWLEEPDRRRAKRPAAPVTEEL